MMTRAMVLVWLRVRMIRTRVCRADSYTLMAVMTDDAR